MTDTTQRTLPSAKDAPATELPFDPLRLLGGILTRRLWVLFAALGGLILGLPAGLLRTETRYEVTVQLIRRDVPASFRAGEVGEAYRPRQIGTATLVGAALSDNVLSRVVAKAKPAVSIGLLRRSAQAREIRNTDFLLLTVSGYSSAAATAELANLWGREVVEFSRELQTRESREVRQYLQQQMETTDADLSRINREIIDISRREGVIDAEKQIDAYLRALGDLDLSCETARIDLQTVDFKIKALETELARHTASGEKLALAKAELEAALTRYTEQNPLVLELRARVAAIEKEAKAALEKPLDDSGVNAFAGSAVGSTLYLQLVQLRADRQGLNSRLAQLERMRTDSRAKLEAMPEKTAGLARLAQTRRSLETARNLLYSRLREAQLFEERSPGYYQLFTPATAETVVDRQKWIKVIVYSVIGLVFGMGLGLASAMAAELLDVRLRTAAEARRVFQAPLALTLKADPDAKARARAATQLWMHWPAPNEAAHQPAIAWVPQPGAGETQFWSDLLAEAERLLPHLLVVDLGIDPCAAFADLSAQSPETVSPETLGCWRLDPARLTLADTRKVSAQLQALATRRPVWVRLTGPVREPFMTLAKCSPSLLVVAQTDVAELAFWQDQSQLLRQSGLKPVGIAVLGVRSWYKLG